MSNEPFVTQLADLCRSERTRAKWVFVSSHAVGLTLGGRLARRGVDWANLRLVTPLDIAVRMAASFLLERGIDPSEEGLGPALVMRLLLDLPEQGGYFRPMAAQPSMADALWRTLRELRMEGLGVGDLPRTAFTCAEKHRELVSLLTAYEHHLAEQGRADLAIVYVEATRHTDWCPVAPDDFVVEAPEARWPTLVRRFLDGLPGRRVEPLAIEVPGGPVPRRGGWLAHARVSLPVEADIRRLQYLLVPERAGTARGDGSLAIFHAGGRDAELDEVLRRIAAAGRPLDQVEIACASDEYTQLVWEKAARLEWPVTVSSGVPAVMTRPGRLLLRFCDWVAGDTAAATLRVLLQSGDCAPKAFGADGDAESLSPGQAARLLLKAQATWGRDTYAPSLDRLAGVYQQRANHPEASDRDRAWNLRKAGQVRRLTSWVADLLAQLPGPDASGRVPLAAVVEAAAKFLERNAGVSSPIDAMAMVVLADALRDLQVLGRYECSLPAALGFIEGCARSGMAGRDRPRPGALHVSRLADAGHDARPLVFVVGLQEGGVFPAAVEDPVLLDAERQAIHPALSTSADRLDEKVHATLARLAAIGATAEHVCFSFSCRDTRGFRDSFPSWLVLQALRLQSGDAALTYDDLARSLGEPVSAMPATPADAVTVASWWLRTCVSTAAARDGILRAFPRLGRGLCAERARDSTGFTEFDGWVPAAGAVLDPTRSERPVSATTLEQAAKCPFSFFLRQGLDVRPIEESEADADVWLTALARGSELHALFARLMRTLRGENRSPDLKRDMVRLREWADECLHALRIAMPPPSEEVFERERQGLHDDLRAFLAAECEGLHGAVPVGFEVSFGLPGDDDGEEPLSSPEPVVIGAGDAGHVKLRGRIDRINQLGPGRFEVVDYKTGGFWKDDWQGTFAGGTRLQHALYSLATEELFRRRGGTVVVKQGRYLFPAVKGRRRQVVIPAPGPEALARVLGALARVVGEGTFVVSEGKNGCKFCEFAAACHAIDPATSDRDEATRAARKVANTSDAVLDAFRELRSHE